MAQRLAQVQLYQAVMAQHFQRNRAAAGRERDTLVWGVVHKPRLVLRQLLKHTGHRRRAAAQLRWRCCAITA